MKSKQQESNFLIKFILTEEDVVIWSLFQFQNNFNGYKKKAIVNSLLIGLSVFFNFSFVYNKISLGFNLEN